MPITLNVPSISCAHCKDTIEHAVSQLEGVDQVEVDIDRHTVEVAFKSDLLSLEQIVAALDEVGYEVES
jgi:copper ion binding protein